MRERDKNNENKKISFFFICYEQYSFLWFGQDGPDVWPQDFITYILTMIMSHFLVTIYGIQVNS